MRISHPAMPDSGGLTSFKAPKSSLTTGSCILLGGSAGETTGGGGGLNGGGRIIWAAASLTALTGFQFSKPFRHTRTLSGSETFEKMPTKSANGNRHRV